MDTQKVDDESLPICYLELSLLLSTFASGDQGRDEWK